MPSPTLLVKGSLVLSDPAKTAKANRDLPINYIISWIKNRMPEYGYNKSDLKDRILVVRAETGSGKSTVLPVEVFRILRNKTTPLSEKYTGKNVICTQPRVLTAKALANDVSGRDWNPDIILGKTVGYQTGPSSNKPEGGLLFATAGVLSVQLEHQSDDSIMSMYKFILVDEAHERSQDCDLLLMYLKNFYLRNVGNKNLPFLLLTSATFDIRRYSTYFDIGIDNTVEVIGRAYPINDHWPKQDFGNYVDGSVSIAKKIHEENHDDENIKCDILIFTPGIKQIELIKLELEKINEQYCLPDSEYDPFLILVINRDIINSQADDFNIMFIKPNLLPKVNGKKVKRRIIIATIVAETGLTVDTLKYVIECGWNKSVEVYQPWEFIGLITRPAPKSKIKQRKGRVGRMFEGEYYPLYTEETYNLLDEQQLPDFITGGIRDKYLLIIKEQQKQKIIMGQFPDFRIEDLTLLDPPPMEAFIMSNAIASLLGFVSECAPLPKQWPPVFFDENLFGIEIGYGLTQLGHIASNINSIKMESIRMILLSYVYDISIEDIINIASIMTIGNLFTVEERKKKEKLPYGTNILFNSIPKCEEIFQFLMKSNSTFDPNSSELDSIKFITMKLFISDNFIEALLIFEYFMKNLNSFQDVEITGGEHLDDITEHLDDTTEHLDDTNEHHNKLIEQHKKPTEQPLRSEEYYEYKKTSFKDWCDTVGLQYSEFLLAMTKRNEIIDELYTVGINPYKNEQYKLTSILSSFDKNKPNIKLLMNNIKDIKKCIYGGYFNNLLHLNAVDNAYYNNQGVKIKLSEPFIASAILKSNGYIEYKPKWIITNIMELTPNMSTSPTIPDPLLYTIKTGKISILDGFVYPDFEFPIPKSCL